MAGAGLKGQRQAQVTTRDPARWAGASVGVRAAGPEGGQASWAPGAPPELSEWSPAWTWTWRLPSGRPGCHLGHLMGRGAVSGCPRA